MMQSKNILWLGLLFVILLTAFCISKYINKFHPNIQTISNPQTEIIDDDIELPPVQLAEVSKNYDEKKDEVDEDYLHVIDLIEQEEKDIEDAYNKALKEEQQKNLEQKERIQPKVTKTIPKLIPIKKPIYKKPKKIVIENVLATQKLSTHGSLNKFEKDRLELLILNIKQNPSYNVKIQTNKNFNKLSQIVSFIKSLGISKEKIKVIHKKSNLIVAVNPDYIELSITKKD